MVDSIRGREDHSAGDSDPLCVLVRLTNLHDDPVDGAGDQLAGFGRILGCAARGHAVILLRLAPSVLLRLPTRCAPDHGESSRT